MLKKFFKNKRNILLIILISISILFTVLLFHKGLLRGHDIEFHLSRIKGLRDSMKNGDFLALVHDGLHGYGYANGLFYGNLFIYIPAILSLFGLSLSKSYFIFIMLCNIITPIIAFFSMKKVCKSDKIAFITSLLYSFSSYRICDVFVRAAIGEVLAFMVFPIILLGLYYIIKEDYKKWWVFSLGYILLIQAHIISAILLTIILFIIILFNIDKFIKEKVRIKYLLFSCILIISLGAFFIFPLLEQYKFSELVVNNLNNDVDLSIGSIKFEKIFLGISYFTEGQFHPPGIGLIFVISCLLRFKIKTDNKELLKLSDICMITGIIILLIITPLFPWKELSTYLKFMQFPWRLYIFSTLFLSISSGIILYTRFSHKKTIIFVISYVCISLAITSYFNYRSIHNYWGLDGMEYISGYNDYYVANGEYLPYNTDVNKLIERGEVVTSNNDELKIDFTKKGKIIKIKYSNNKMKNTYIEVPLLYYIGYGTNKDYEISKGDNNIVRINLNKENDEFVIYYKGTIIQKISYIISLMTLIIFIIFLRKRMKFINIKK